VFLFLSEGLNVKIVDSFKKIIPACFFCCFLIAPRPTVCLGMSRKAKVLLASVGSAALVSVVGLVAYAMKKPFDVRKIEKAQKLIEKTKQMNNMLTEKYAIYFSDSVSLSEIQSGQGRFALYYFCKKMSHNILSIRFALEDIADMQKDIQSRKEYVSENQTEDVALFVEQYDLLSKELTTQEKRLKLLFEDLEKLEGKLKSSDEYKKQVKEIEEEHKREEEERRFRKKRIAEQQKRAGAWSAILRKKSEREKKVDPFLQAPLRTQARESLCNTGFNPELEKFWADPFNY